MAPWASVVRPPRGPQSLAGSRGGGGELHRRFGWALWSAGKWDEMARVWQEAVSSFEARGDWPHVSELSLALADVFRTRQELDGCERWAEKALRTPGLTPGERAHALCLLGGTRCLRK